MRKLIPMPQIKDLADLDPLASCRHLEFLSLKGSPVASLPHYRLWLIFRCKNLRVLDFDKIKDKVPCPLCFSLYHRTEGRVGEETSCFAIP